MGESSFLHLEAFILENAELERLEELLSQFNIFEAIGAVRQELRHSDFLAYLLAPENNHGMGDVFVRKLLQKVSTRAGVGASSVTAVDFDTWDLSQLEVFREWLNIDILIKDDENRFVVAIENKIDTGEHTLQLERYWQVLDEHFRGWKKIGVYLTPSGERPSNENFAPVSHDLVASILEDVTKTRASTLGPEVRTLVTHYTQMLRRHIVAESEIADLCRRIYRKHRQALDLIYDHRPDQQAIIQETLEDLVRAIDYLILDDHSKRRVLFAPREWDELKLKVSEGWTSSGRILLFEFQNEPDSLKLKLILGPGPLEVRERLFRMAQENVPLFRTPSKSLNQKWNELFSRTFLSEKSYTDSSDEKIRAEIQEHWQRFVVKDLPEICTKVGRAA